ncbi:probable glucosamine 6-phosphate N-acetyltransferase [Ceratina calcarata]|uniref:Glucosamine 6-phosphate N-acetyltransferase n=1 Tax=Ceratina calcarata TaxID=156304 RepID=A0AAJ7JDE7_9HYME|nr:probable glucosamine 6-phosphate N-acetyltransferase [Ceratina calcarata]
MNSTKVERSLEDTETELFNPNVLDRLSLTSPEGLVIRPLKSGDYDRGFLQLLTQLTQVGNISREQFLNRFHMMRSTNSYYVIVVEDVSLGSIVATSMLVVEQKFVHNCALKGRLEDVVVDDKYRGKHLGKLVVKIATLLAHYLQCYKVSLDCKDHLIPFYESLGFIREPNNANYLNMRCSKGNTTEKSRLG